MVNQPWISMVNHSYPFLTKKYHNSTQNCPFSTIFCNKMTEISWGFLSWRQIFKIHAYLMSFNASWNILILKMIFFPNEKNPRKKKSWRPNSVSPDPGEGEGGSYGTLWYHKVPYGTIRDLMVPYGTIWYHMVPYGTIWYLGRGGARRCCDAKSFSDFWPSKKKIFFITKKQKIIKTHQI